MNYLLSADNVSREFITKNNRLEILKNISFAVKKNDTIAITGVSGSGKSTLLQILGGLDKPNSGKVYFHKKSIYDSGSSWISKYRIKNIGFVFQSYHLLSELNLLENIALPSIPLEGIKKSKTLAYELINDIGLKSRLSHKPNELSGGERQRVAIARALINQPDVILADEPTGNLDQSSAQNVLDILFELVKTRGLSLVLVTHSDKVANNCYRRFLLKDNNLTEV